MAIPRRQFEFSPSVQLFLTNLPTIRKVQKMLDLRDHLKSGQLGSPKIRPVKRPVWRGCHDCRRVAAPQVDK